MAKLETRRFRLKVTIEAFVFGEDDQPWWWREQVASGVYVSQWPGRDGKPAAAQIESLSGLVDVCKGDYVIRNSNGEIACVKPDVFPTLYEQEEAR